MHKEASHEPVYYSDHCPSPEHEHEHEHERDGEDLAQHTAVGEVGPGARASARASRQRGGLSRRRPGDQHTLALAVGADEYVDREHALHQRD